MAKVFVSLLVTVQSVVPELELELASGVRGWM
jgi:hypothetical protein